MRLPTKLAMAVAVTLGAAVLLGISQESDAGVPATVRIPIVRAHGKGDPKPAALFSHWSHNQYACYGCHPSIFPQAQLGFTHDDLDAGRYCAACHNGKSAWAFDDQKCSVCHR